MPRLTARGRYLDMLRGWDGRGLCVLAGMMHAGKTSVVRQLIVDLRARGVRNEAIRYIETGPLTDLEAALSGCGGAEYVFIDCLRGPRDVRAAEEWSLGNPSSGVLAVAHNRRCAPEPEAFRAEVMPLSFAEFASMNPCDISFPSMAARFGDYAALGALPCLRAGGDPDAARALAEATMSDAVLNGLAPWSEVRDAGGFSRTFAALAELAGAPASPASVAEMAGLRTPRAAAAYIRALEDAYMLIRVPRYDLRAKRELKTQARHFFTDHGVFARTGAGAGDVLRSIVAAELARRGYALQTGVVRDAEVCFVARRDGRADYVAVAPSLADDIADRQVDAMLALPGRRKAIVTADERRYDDVGGIRIVNHIDFLMSRRRRRRSASLQASARMPIPRPISSSDAVAKFRRSVFPPPRTWNGRPGMTTSPLRSAASYTFMASVPSGVLSQTNIPPDGSFHLRPGGSMSSIRSKNRSFFRRYSALIGLRYSSKSLSSRNLSSIRWESEPACRQPASTETLARSAIQCGTTIHPTLMPGDTVFETEPVSTTSSDIERTALPALPAYPSSPYASSSTISVPDPSRSSATCLLASSE